MSVPIWVNGLAYLPAIELEALAAELADWKRMRNEAMAVAMSNRERINELEVALRMLGYAVVEYMRTREDQEFMQMYFAEMEARKLLPSQVPGVNKDGSYTAETISPIAVTVNNDISVTAQSERDLDGTR